ncbi:MAG: hypothetical protein PHI34_09020 [Acidobacteriota bacterium]|nr:hypothetical protein [Acidobacteriota bacterium]
MKIEMVKSSAYEKEVDRNIRKISPFDTPGFVGLIRSRDFNPDFKIGVCRRERIQPDLKRDAIYIMTSINIDTRIGASVSRIMRGVLYGVHLESTEATPDIFFNDVFRARGQRLSLYK